MMRVVRQNRRNFLKALGLGLPAGNLLAVFSPLLGEDYVSKGAEFVTVYADAAHFTLHESLAEYQLPQKTGFRNSQYINSIGEETFLARHWFV